MNLSRRSWIKKMGLGAAALGAGAQGARADSFPTDGDPAYAGFARNLFKIKPTMQDVPSAFLRGGKVVQPEREIPVFSTVDVAVVGGGAAGFAAAVAAARTGAKVALVERYGSLGGLFTNGMVLIILATVFKDGGGLKLATAGLCKEFMDRLREMGPDAITPFPKEYGQPTADPEAAKVLMDRMVEESGVEMFFHAWGVDVIQDGPAVQGVIFESKQGRQAVLAKCVVDATGDGDVNFLAGGGFQQITHAMGFVYQVGNVDRIDFANVPKAKRQAWRANEPVRSLRWVNSLGPKGNGLDVRELSKAEVAHRRGAWNKVQKQKKEPGFEQIFLSNTCSMLGPRATRLLEGVATISKETAESRAAFDDTVAVSGDDRRGYPAPFAIPYRALLPKTVDNVICAGRCISCTSDLIDRVRLIAPCFVTGQAAGVAAAIAAKSSIRPRDVPAKAIQEVLLKQGAYLG